MKVTELKVYPVKTAAGKVKANGIVTFEEAVDLKFIVMAGPKGDFISWAGGKAYKKKDGTNGWDSPIFIKDKSLNDDLTGQILAKLKAYSSGNNNNASIGQTNDASFASDDIPF